MSRATLNDLVEDFLRFELGYGEEFVVSNEIGTLYDVEEIDNLEKKLSELGIKGDSFLTVIDEDEENPRVNLVINVQESPAAMDDKPILPLDAHSYGQKPIFDIPRRQKSIANPTETANGDVQNTNGSVIMKRKAEETLGSSSSANKRSASGFSGDTPIAKRSKVAQNGGPAPDNELIILDDTGDDAIVIDDD